MFKCCWNTNFSLTNALSSTFLTGALSGNWSVASYPANILNKVSGQELFLLRCMNRFRTRIFHNIGNLVEYFKDM